MCPQSICIKTFTEKFDNLAPEHVIAHSLFFEKLTSKKTELFLLIFVLENHVTWHTYVYTICIHSSSPMECLYLVIHTSRKFCLQVSQPLHWGALKLMEPEWSMWNKFQVSKFLKVPGNFSRYLAILTIFLAALSKSFFSSRTRWRLQKSPNLKENQRTGSFVYDCLFVHS